MNKYSLLTLFFFILGFNTIAKDRIIIEKIEILENSNNFHNPILNSKIIPKNAIINLNYSQNSFIIYFNSSTIPLNYFYKINNFSSKTFQTKNNHILFTDLATGEYELIISCDNKYQVNSTRLKIVIEPPIWLQWWFLPMMFVYALILIGVFMYFLFQYRTRQQLRLQAVRHELEIKALRAQMNPHFIFNSMNTIDAYILRKRFIEASDCLQKFSKLIRQILENSKNQTISIAQELETLKLYIELEQERFSHSFSYQFNIQPELLEKDYQIPPLLIQPFVENAILHGIRHLTQRKGEILLNLSIKDSLLLCIITDNGIGRKASSEINQQKQENHKSMGVDITMERISAYQALYGDKMETTITDLEEGTKVEITLPLISN